MVGERVQFYRKERGLSLTVLADLAGVSKSYLSAIERGVQSNPSIHFLEKISSVLDVPMDSFLHDETIVSTGTQLDQEWIELIQLAKTFGVTAEQFREYIEFNQWKLDRVHHSPMMEEAVLV